MERGKIENGDDEGCMLRVDVAPAVSDTSPDAQETVTTIFRTCGT